MHRKTDRLILRNLQEKDAENYLTYHNSEFVLRYNCMQPETPEQVKELIEKNKSKDDHIAIAMGDTDDFVGMIYVEEDSLRYGANSVEVAYWLGEPFARQGYMREALGAAVEDLLKEYDSVTSRSFADNLGSVSLLRSLGFRQEGHLHKAVRGYDGVLHDDLLFSKAR